MNKKFLLGVTIFISCVFIISISSIYLYLTSRKVSTFAIPPPYITQELAINIYTTNTDYDKYKWLFKANLVHNLFVSDGKNIVLVPKTVTNIPVNIFNNPLATNSGKSIFTIIANGIEMPIKECDFRATTF
jgi:hypothetical protein